MTTTAIGASRVASQRRSGSEFVQSDECETLISTVVNSWDYEAKRHFRECEVLRLALVGAIKKAKGW